MNAPLLPNPQPPARPALSRRGVLVQIAAAAGTCAAGAGGLLLPGCAAQSPGLQTYDDGRNASPKSPGEDLMNQHGVLNRTMLVYEEVQRRCAAAEDFDPSILHDAAHIIDAFVEKFHERLEGHYIFPRMRFVPRFAPLVFTLGWQHHAGRRITAQLLHLGTADRLRDADNRRRAADLIGRFVYMYRAHEAREDTVLFPEFRKLLTANEYAALGEDFQREERKEFGADGFERWVDAVARLEKRIGIDSLWQHTRDA